jgi:hypothetical protein
VYVLNGSTGIDTVAYTYGVTGTTGVSVSLALTGCAGDRRFRQRHTD